MNKKLRALRIIFLTGTLCTITAIEAENALTWETIIQKSPLHLYAGNIVKNHSIYGDHPANETHVGLSLYKNNYNHIQHDITNPMPLPDNCVDSYQSEDVFEHIEYDFLPGIINEIYRVLKPGSFLRISVPDYRCDILYNRSLKDENGAILFDAGGGGRYVNGKVVDGGHVWFPTIELVTALLEKTDFFTQGTIEYLHYYDINGASITNPIDYSKGYVQRTPDNDPRVQNPYRGMSLIVDLYKN